MKLTMYSKKGCSPCVFFYEVFTKTLGKDFIEKKEFDTDQEVLSEIEKYGMCKIPFLVIGKDSIIKPDDMMDFHRLLVKTKNIGMNQKSL